MDSQSGGAPAADVPETDHSTTTSLGSWSAKKDPENGGVSWCQPGKSAHKPSVFLPVNGNHRSANSGVTFCPPGIAPKFKISRGTQASISSPPVPAKPMNVARPCGVKSPPPPVPPKPASYNKSPSPNKPTTSIKPALPPKPVLKSGAPLANRSQRPTNKSPQFVKPSSPIAIVKQTRKCSSLGRLEGIRCSAMLSAGLMSPTEDERNLQRDSGFVSCSLENVENPPGRLLSITSHQPVAPPRRRRKSAESGVEPIYAVVDFSKKLNRRFPALYPKPSQPSADEPDHASGCSTMAGTTQAEISDIQCELDMIESSFATISSIMESFNQPADVTSAVNRDEEEKADCPKPITARLVFGGAVVQPEANIMTPTDDTPSSKKMMEFKDAIAVLPSPTGTEVMPLVADPQRARQPSPVPSTSSSCSSDSKEEEEDSLATGKHFDPDVMSAGSLGDVDTSDATRQNSVEDDSNSASVDASDKKDQPFGFRRTLDSIFGSFGKSNLIRKGAEKRKTNDRDSSSTDTDPIQGARPHLCVSRTAPLPPGQKFNRVDRVYRSIQPTEKARANSLDAGQLIYSLGGSGSLSPVIGSPESVVNLHSNRDSAECDGESFAGERPGSPVDSASESEDPLRHSLEGKERKAYLTAKEIASSERVFVDCLRLICVDFRKAVTEASAAGGREGPVIPEADLNRILSYLPHLQNLNEELLGDFELRLARWAVEPKIADVIVRKGPFLKLYSAYIRDFQAQSALLDECVQKYPRFGKTLKEFEMSERCKNLKLKTYMLKPVQRLPQYRLLLEVYLKHLSESSPDYQDTLAALKVVTDVAEHANNSMKHEDNFQKLMRMQSRLGNCEIIKPGRYIIKEGELDKVSRKTLQPRYFILLNDCLLYTSYVGSPSPTCGLKLHHELPLNRMEVQLPTGSTLTKESDGEFNVISTTRSFTLSTSSTALRDEWMAALEEAISQFQSRQSTFPTKSTSGTESVASEPRLGQQAPVWIPDSRVTMCQLCTSAFSITFRRHHCRACGKVVCRNCSSHKAELEYLKFRSARVCDDCFSVLADDCAMDDDLNTSTCSSTIEPDISASLVNVPPVCYVHAFNDDQQPRPSSDPVNLPTSQAGLRAQQVRNVRKERRYIPQRLTEVSANDAGSQMSGYLMRRSKRSWKRNWFVLKDRVLYSYKASEDVVALDTIPVLGYRLQVPSELDSEECEQMFQLYHPKQSPIVFQADSTALAKKWIEALSLATVL